MNELRGQMQLHFFDGFIGNVGSGVPDEHNGNVRSRSQVSEMTPDETEKENERSGTATPIRAQSSGNHQTGAEGGKPSALKTHEPNGGR